MKHSHFVAEASFVRDNLSKPKLPVMPGIWLCDPFQDYGDQDRRVLAV
jgi:hypothetical protein